MVADGGPSDVMERAIVVRQRRGGGVAMWRMVPLNVHINHSMCVYALIVTHDTPIGEHVMKNETCEGCEELRMRRIATRRANTRFFFLFPITFTLFFHQIIYLIQFYIIHSLDIEQLY